MERNEIFCKSIQRILFKWMDSDNNNQEAIHCEDDGEYRKYFNRCDKLSIERF